MTQRNSILALLYHAAFVVFMLAPILVVCVMAFTPESYLTLPTTSLSLRWFYEILNYPEFFRAAKTSLWLGALSSSIVVLLATPAALAMARHDFRGRGALMALFLSPLMIPHVVMGVALLRFFNQAGLAGTFAGLLLSHIIVIFPFALRLTLSSAIGMDRRLEQAAASLGADRGVIFRRVVLPLIAPGMISGWILSFIQSFDEVTMTVFIATPGTETLPVRMFAYIQDNIDPMITSVSACVILVTAVLIVIADRLFGLDAILFGNADRSRK